MAKESFYFAHDYNPTNDPKIVCLIGNYGGLGYGIFWRIVEMLHQENNHKLPKKKYIYEAIAKQMLASVEQTEAMVHDCIETYELFESNDTHFWSSRVLTNIEKRQEISEKRSIAGRAGAIAKQNLANTSKGKERKENEIKEKETTTRVAFAPPSLKEVSDYCLLRANQVNAEQFINFYASKGWFVGKNKMKDWRACVQTWEHRDKQNSPVKQITTNLSKYDKLN